MSLSVPGLMARAPWWLSVTVGLLLVTLGSFLFFRPLTSLSILGVYIGISCVISGLGDLLAHSPESDQGSGASSRRSPLETAAGLLWILVGLAILVWLGRSIGLLGPVVAITLVVSGVVALVRLSWDRSSDAWLAAVFGLSEVAFGVVALTWPDATLIVVAILFGARTAVFGLTLLWRGIGSRLHWSGVTEMNSRSGSRIGIGFKWVAAVLVLGLATATLMVSHAFRGGIPVADPFYDPPAEVPETPGRLLAWEPYAGNLPPGMTGYRLLYVTTNAEGLPVLASAALALPAAGTGPVPLIAWAHGTVGVARGCAPTIGPDAITEKGMPAMDSLARNGWAMVATDYPGMGTEGAFPYLIGEGQGRAVLDAARAAHQVPGALISQDTVIWGHSQGGHAALWAGELAPTYAPDLNVLGTAALSPASSPYAMAETVLAHPGAPGASLGVSFVVDAYTRYYDDLHFDRVVAPSARTIVREAAARCTSQGATLITVLAGLAIASDQPIVREDALEGIFGDRLRENIPDGPWEAPLFIGQGEADEVVPFSMNVDYVDGLCRAGVAVEFEGYPGGTHMSILETGSALSLRLEEWTKARFAGRPAPDGCS